VKVAGRKSKWLENVSAYTVAGGITSMLVGGAIGLLGSVILPTRLEGAALAVVLLLILAAIARDAGLSDIRLPQVHRQTDGNWAKRHGGTAAAVFWGLDLGLTFSTWLNLSGAWVLASIAFVTSPTLGMAVFGAFWVGRALSVWIAPVLISRATELPVLLAALTDEHRLLRRIHVCALLGALLVIGWWSMSGRPI
jgi:hypothetical protein